ncbi:MAG: hypothetical protein IPH46_00295 [Bacteroidetes bacterium]|nr:hypothetical protein [Bacteroidota bacterium]
MKKIKMTSILMLGLGIFGAHAQDAVLTAGGRPLEAEALLVIRWGK